MSRIAPDQPPRLEFYLVDADGAPVTNATYGAVSSAKHRTITNGVRSAVSAALTLTADALVTDAVAAGQFIVLNADLGFYAIDFTAGAALATAEFSEAVIVMANSSHVAHPVRHAIDVATSTRSDVTTTAFEARTLPAANYGDVKTTAFEARTLTASSYSTHDAAAVVTLMQAIAAEFKATGFAVAGDAMTLQPGERTTLADVIDAALLNAGDATDLVASIVARIANTNVSEAGLVGLIRADNERAGGMLALLQAAVAALPDTTGISDQVLADIAIAHGSGSYTTYAGGGSSGEVTVTDITAAALAKFLSVDTGLTAAEAGSVGKVSQGAAGDVTDQLNRIELQTGQITSGKIKVVRNVTPGGTITTYLGDDDVGSNALKITVSDAGESLKTLLQGDAIASVLFGAGTGDVANQIKGTVDPEDITHADGTTTIPVEILSAGKTGKPGDDYTYHIKAITTDGDYENVKVDGCLNLRAERRTP